MKRLYGWLVLLAVLTAVSIAPSVLGRRPDRCEPSDPLMVTGSWQTLAPNSRVWYYFDYTGDRSRIQVWLDDNGSPDVEMGIFTPDLVQQWIKDSSTKPWGAAPNRGLKPLWRIMT